jgi:hypothetical protein
MLWLIAIFAAAPVETITYETTGCDGRCPVMVVEVRSDGTGTFEGKAHTAVIGKRDFTVTASQYVEYRQRLEPHRPEGERLLDAANCPEPAAIDYPSIEVRWTDAGRSDRLLLYLGCEMVWNSKFVDEVGLAPEVLGITHWVRGD